MNISKSVINVLILVLVNLDQASAATLFSHHDCEFTANVPGRMQPLEKRTDVGMVYGGMSALNIQGVNRQLAFQVECQKMANTLYNSPVATDVALATLTQLSLKIGATKTSYNVEKTPFSVRGVSRGIINRISPETVMRTELHVGKKSLIILRVIGHQRDVDKIVANEFFNSVSR